MSKGMVQVDLLVIRVGFVLRGVQDRFWAKIGRMGSLESMP